MVRAKELFTWTPSFESIKEHDYSSEDESVQGVGSKENKYNTYEKEEGEFNNSEDEEVAETDFMETYSQKPVEENLEPSPSLSHPPGFSPVGSLNSSDKELNKEFSPTISAKVMEFIGFRQESKVSMGDEGVENSKTNLGLVTFILNEVLDGVKGKKQDKHCFLKLILLRLMTGSLGLLAWTVLEALDSVSTCVLGLVGII
ncbi:hypothetical protein Tco_0163743 [Tanacetum coccineum]|uniref:Uncharacterized protein n=1 Tax=Tanacetum coccineum TaxID=301880 RepID=A0ABQ5H3E1_9ASTR